MKRIAVIVTIVLGVAATPAVVTASSTRAGSADTYARAQTWKSPVGDLYGPVQPRSSASYGFIVK